jgi:hypothetical protein
VEQPGLLAGARRLWDELAGLAPQPWTGTRVVVAPSSRLCPAGWVGVVTVDGATLVTVPDAATAGRVRAVVGREPPARLTEPSTWSGLAPTAHLGPARLLYGRSDVGAPGADEVTTLEPGSDEVVALLAAVSPAEAGESGLDGVTSPVFVRRDDAGAVVAAAGYVAWPAATAHVCVLTAPASRGLGHAGAVGAAAVGHATRHGMLSQWRAQVGPSVAVARRLGLHDLGAQLSLRLSDPSPGPPR